MIIIQHAAPLDSHADDDADPVDSIQQSPRRLDGRGALTQMQEIRIRTTARSEMVEITDEVQAVVAQGGVRDGAAVIQSLHTTAALTINENADPFVVDDVLLKLDRLIPREEKFYRHAEGNSDSHLKTSFFGPSLMVIVSGGQLVLGTWQGIYLCEFDGPRERRVAIQLLRAG